MGPGHRLTVEPDRAERDRALAALAALAVRPGRAVPSRAYRREDLAVRWGRFPGSGFDTKDLVFGRFLTDVDTEDDLFTVREGLLAEDFHTGEPIRFTQAEEKKDWQIEIDHTVSFSDAFASGAHRWSLTGRNWARFADDLRGLLPVARRANASKGGKNAAEWLPPNPRTDFRARLVITQITMKSVCRLSVTEAEAAAMRAARRGLSSRFARPDRRGSHADRRPPLGGCREGGRHACA